MISKSKVRDPNGLTYGQFEITRTEANEEPPVGWLTLAQVEKWLDRPPATNQERPS